MKRKKLLAFGMGIVMGLSPVSVFAAQQEDISDKMLENNVIMQTEEVVVEEEAAEEGLQDQMDVLQEEGLGEVLRENDVEEMEELEIELPEVNKETAQEDVAIDETNFPDDVFRQYVQYEIDKDGNGRLSAVEIENVKNMNISASEKENVHSYGTISSLKGIEYFISLKELECSWNELRSLDVSHNQLLEKLNCGGNELRSLDVSQNAVLKKLFCYNNKLRNLDVSQNVALVSLGCSGNKLRSLDVSHNQLLDWLNCGGNELRSLDVSQNAALEYLDCDGNQLSSLDVSQNAALEDLRCSENQIRIEGRQINVLSYDDKFDAGKASNLQGLSLDGGVFTILGGYESGTYDYDCGKKRTMTVTISENTKEPAGEVKYEDVEEIPGNWKYESVKYISEKGIMGGVGGSTQFQPDNSLTRAMFATVLYRMEGEPDVKQNSKFSDVEWWQWYGKAIIWANQEGIVSGYSDGRYGINDNITREQIAKMLYLYGQSGGYDVSGASSLDSFTDKNAVSGWAVDYMQWAVNAQMISGKPNGDGTFRLDPKGQATRAECAKMLMMFMEKYK